MVGERWGTVRDFSVTMIDYGKRLLKMVPGQNHNFYWLSKQYERTYASMSICIRMHIEVASVCKMLCHRSGDEQHVQALVARAIGSHAQTQKRQYRLPLDHAVRGSNRNVKLGSSWKQPQFRSQLQQTHTRVSKQEQVIMHKSINLSYLLLLPNVVVHLA